MGNKIVMEKLGKREKMKIIVNEFPSIKNDLAFSFSE